MRAARGQRRGAHLRGEARRPGETQQHEVVEVRARHVARVRDDAGHGPQLLRAIALAQVVLAQVHSHVAVRASGYPQEGEE